MIDLIHKKVYRAVAFNHAYNNGIAAYINDKYGFTPDMSYGFFFTDDRNHNSIIAELRNNIIDSI